jgi:hypothetical protein
MAQMFYTLCKTQSIIFLGGSFMQVKSGTAIAEKWARVTPQRTADYEAGVRQPTKDWATQTANAEDSYSQGVQKAVQDKRFGKGVKAAGTSKWQEKAISKGTQRWGPGVSIAENDYESGFEPYRQEMEKVNLPPRFPKGDPRNIQRVAAIATALHKKKVSN